MKWTLALGWRLLLVFALVANPLAAAFAAPCHQTATEAMAGAPPCHTGMASAAQADKPSPAGMHGHDCAKAGCDFGACCATCVLLSPLPGELLHPPLANLSPAKAAKGLAGPPLPPWIRPPIA